MWVLSCTQHRSSSSSSSFIIFIHLHLENRGFQNGCDVKIRKTPTTKARTLDNLIEDSMVHIRR
ncbi:hypothetical protein Hdeb2414_s0672g00933461 [Helianthus debilis subsp. tardiflorus]